MIKFPRFVLPIILALGVGAVILPGCSGGNSGASLPDISRFSGNYGGTFTGVIQSGTNQGTTIGGTFDATIDDDGNVTGTIAQDGVGTAPVTGTLARNGRVTLSTPAGNGTSSTLVGRAKLTSRGVLLSGDYVTTSNGERFVVGSFEGTRLEIVPL